MSGLSGDESATKSVRSLPVGSKSEILEANNPVARNKALLEGQRYVPGKQPFLSLWRGGAVLKRHIFLGFPFNSVARLLPLFAMSA